MILWRSSISEETRWNSTRVRVFGATFHGQITLGSTHREGYRKGKTGPMAPAPPLRSTVAANTYQEAGNTSLLWSQLEYGTMSGVVAVGGKDRQPNLYGFWMAARSSSANARERVKAHGGNAQLRI